MRRGLARPVVPAASPFRRADVYQRFRGVSVSTRRQGISFPRAWNEHDHGAVCSLAHRGRAVEPSGRIMYTVLVRVSANIATCANVMGLEHTEDCACASAAEPAMQAAALSVSALHVLTTIRRLLDFASICTLSFLRPNVGDTCPSTGRSRRTGSARMTGAI